MRFPEPLIREGLAAPLGLSWPGARIGPLPSISIILSAIAFYLSSSVFLICSVRKLGHHHGWWKALVVHPTRLRQWHWMLICFVGCVLASRPLAYVLLLASYRADGFTASQADWAIPDRELGHGGAGAGGQVWPLMTAAVILPLVALALPPRLFRTAATLLLLLGLIASTIVVFLHRTAPVPS